MKDRDFLPFIILGFLGILIIFVIYKLYGSSRDEEPTLEATPIVVEEEKTIYKAKPVHLEEVVEKYKAIISDDEMMAKSIQEEAGGECLIGQVAVGITMLNRSDYYGETIETVLKKPNQYCYHENTVPSASCYRAVIIAKFIKQHIPDLFPDTMMWFQPDGYHTEECCGEPYIQIGNHYFNYLSGNND